MEVRWAVVDGFPNYEVSTLGEVYNTKFKRYVHPRKNPEGYLRVTLFHNGVGREKYIHVLVARAFFSDFRDNAQVTQVNGDKEDNRLENLRLRGNTRPYLERERRRPWGRRVKIVETGEVFRTVGDLARYIGGDYSKVYACLRGERNHHLGYTFEYYEE